MLLLMIAAEFSEFMHLGVIRVGQQGSHCRVNVTAVGTDAVEVRSRDHAATGTGLTLANGLVIRIEKEVEGGIEFLIARGIFSENHALEEPRRMSEMPFCRTGVRHRLNGRIRVGKRGCKNICMGANILELR